MLFTYQIIATFNAFRRKQFLPIVMTISVFTIQLHVVANKIIAAIKFIVIITA